jgi:hypothetical protein
MMSQDCALVRPGPLPDKIHDRHRERLAIVYIRQSTPQQVERHQESTRLQYALVERAAYVHESDRHFHQSGHPPFNHSRHFARAPTGPAPGDGASRWRLT